MYELGGFGRFGVCHSNFQESEEEEIRAAKEFRDGVSAYFDQPFDKSRSRIWKIGWLEQAEQVFREYGEEDEQ
jgi:hypothetical protein